MANLPVLSITGSDSTGKAGIQSDIKTISAMGGYALTAITSVTVQNSQGIHNIHDLPEELIVSQVKAIIEDVHPRAVKVGLLRNAELIKPLRDEIVACRNIVCDPGIMSSDGTLLCTSEAVERIKCHIIPETTILVLKCIEAEYLLHHPVNADDEMLKAAQELTDMGAKAVLLRGGKHLDGMLSALLYTEKGHKFFSSRNTEGWQKHGVGGALSTAIATRLAFGDEIEEAISNAHAFIHAQLVYAIPEEGHAYRSAELYNKFMSLIADHYREAHDVAFYADKLAITQRYLSQITDKNIGKSPKQIISDYLMNEALLLLNTSGFTVQELSDRLGFSSQAQFCKFFRQQRGQSPSDYRKAFSNANQVE